tara:strand:+ start:20 stop:457 length:438 start_codon:yes stop_codon:yes gene_type:complete
MNLKGIIIGIAIVVSIGIIAINVTQSSNVDYYTVEAWYDHDFKMTVVNIHFVSDTGDFVKTDGSMLISIHEKSDDYSVISRDISFSQGDFMTWQNEYGAKQTGLQIPIDRPINRQAQYYVQIDSLQLSDGSILDKQIAYFDTFWN